MRIKLTILSLGYWFSSTNLGMMLHPYKTVRELVRKKGFSPMIFSPMVWVSVFWGLAVVSIVFGRVGARETGLIYPKWLYDLLELFFWWITWFMILWQVLVLYLYTRFKAVFKKA